MATLEGISLVVDERVTSQLSVQVYGEGQEHVILFECMIIAIILHLTNQIIVDWEMADCGMAHFGHAIHSIDVGGHTLHSIDSYGHSYVSSALFRTMVDTGQTIPAIPIMPTVIAKVPHKYLPYTCLAPTSIITDRNTTAIDSGRVNQMLAVAANA